MASVAAVLGFLLLVFLLALPVYWAWRLVVLLGAPEASPAAAELPRAAVILALRGPDPSLPACLAGLLAQDYPAYSLHIIVDSRDDPAWDVVQEVLAKGRPAHVTVKVSPLEKPLTMCSLKLSAQLQAVAELETSCQVVALIDADVIPGRTWLRSLVAPLAEPRVGAATGIRWYAPEDAGWGSLVRYLWNAAACTQMLAFRIAWGGSLAFRADVLRSTGLLQQWAHSFSEDTGVGSALRQAGFDLRFVGAATMVNREATDLAGCRSFIQRQLLCVRLHHPRWPIILAANVGIGLAVAAALVLFPVCLLTQAWSAAAWLGGLLQLFILGLVAALLWAELVLRRRAQERGEVLPRAPSPLKLLLAVLRAVALHGAGLLAVLRQREVVWRGVTYRLEGRGQVRLVEYRPYRLAAPATRPTQSLT
jgi:cellulose synthase/poly-beta-1,6-N-acetylglucosamine synthase-like glycosyltransferase